MTHFRYHEVDRDQLAKDLDDIRAEVMANLGKKDFQHLKKIERWGRLCSSIGYGTAWIIPNPISAYFISQGNMTRWTTIAHHILHRGYNKIEGIPRHYTSKGFAKGKRRYLDWFEWMVPEAWDKEHNDMHHYNLGEQADLDQIEFNTKNFRAINMPLLMRYFLLGLMACIWKFYYYAPVTLRHFRNFKSKKVGKAIPPLSKINEWNPLKPEGRELWNKCLIPYASIRFVFIPLLFFPIGVVSTIGGAIAASNVLINSLLAELMTNVHTFLVIGTNHAGEDLYLFEDKATNKGEFYLRQILGSTNFKTGSDPVDFVHGWLNYQIEHHLWPDIPLSCYQRAQPKVKAICEKHGIPYCQEPVLTRLWKTMNVMTGQKVMLKPSMVS